MSSDMLREASESLFEFLIETFPPERPYSRSDIEQDPMPPLLAHFLTQTLQHKLETEVEHLRSVRSPWFNYDHVDVQASYKTFVSSLAHHSFIPAEEWRACLKRATKLVIAHLVLPTHTLVEYIFHEGDGPLPAPVIYRQLMYFAAYPYLREAVEAFLKQRQLKEIDRTRFSSLLTQIDKHMTANYTSDEWLRLLKPMLDLSRRVPLTSKQGAPIDLLSMFFGDKEAYEIQERLQVEKELHRTVMINEIALRKVIEGSVGPFEQKLVPTPQPQAPAPASAPEPQTAQPVSEPNQHVEKEAAQDVEPQVDQQQEAESDSPKPLWEQFQQNPGKPPPQPVIKKQEPKPAPKPDEPAIPLWMQFQKKPEAAPPKPVAAAPVAAAPVAEPPAAVQDTVVQDTVVQEPPAHEPAPSASENQEHSSDSQPQPQAPPPTLQVETPQPNIVPPAVPVQPNGAPQETPIPTQESQQAAPAKPNPESMTLEQLEFSVLGLYGTSNRDMFIEHLFSGSSVEYRATLMRLHTLSTWTMASHLIAEEVFKKNNVNIYSPAAIMFTESIEEQYKLN